MTQTVSSPISQADLAAKHQKSFGEYMFDASVYGGIGYLANAAVSMAVTRYAIQLPGNSLYRMGLKSHAQFEKVFSQFMSDPKAIKSWSDLGNNVLFLGSGGWLLIVPMKWAEDAKLSIVQQIDDWFGTGPKTPEAVQAQQAYFADMPKQSYASLFGGRVITYPLIIAGAVPLMVKTELNVVLNDFLTKHLSHPLGNMVAKEAFIDAASKEAILAGTGAAMHFGFSKTLAFIQHHFFNDNTASRSSDKHAVASFPRSTIFQAETPQPLRSNASEPAAGLS